MILSENSSTLGSRCCSAARSETEWQRNESWKVRRLVPKLNMRPERRPLQVGVPQGVGGALGASVRWWLASVRWWLRERVGARHLGEGGRVAFPPG